MAPGGEERPEAGGGTVLRCLALASGDGIRLWFRVGSTQFQVDFSEQEARRLVRVAQQALKQLRSRQGEDGGG